MNSMQTQKRNQNVMTKDMINLLTEIDEEQQSDGLQNQIHG